MGYHAGRLEVWVMPPRLLYLKFTFKIVVVHFLLLLLAFILVCSILKNAKFKTHFFGQFLFLNLFGRSLAFLSYNW